MADSTTTTRLSDSLDGSVMTEVGLIPADWDVDAVANRASITTGGRNTQDRLDEGIYPFFVRSQTVERINSFSFDGEAVLTAGDGVGTGKIFHYINGKFDFHQRVYKISDFDETLNGYFFYLYFSRNFYNRIMQMTAKSSVDSVRREMIADMKIPLPPVPEQEAIAEVLRDVDALILALDDLIEKKRDIQRGAMQQLLTGKQRLDGFTGTWRDGTLGDVCRSITDGTHFTPHYVESGIPFYSVENVVANDFENVRFITPEAHKQLIRRCKPERGDILLTRIGSLGTAKLIDWDVNASIYVSLALLKVDSSNDAGFIVAYMNTRMFRTDLEDRSLLNATPKKINMGDIGKIPLTVPPTKEEQVRIGGFFLDLARELETLEAERAKYLSIKTGMMQELLTGKTRLL